MTAAEELCTTVLPNQIAPKAVEEGPSSLGLMSSAASGEEMGTPTKTSKTSETSKEQVPPASNSAPVTCPDWVAAFQAYYGPGTPLPPPGYFSAGPQPHPYMWGAQPLMPPYATPPPYPAMYHYGGMYMHPSVAAQTVSGAGGEGEGNGKPSYGNDRSPVKRSKGSLGVLSIKGSSASSMNGVASHSGDSGSEGSSDGSDGNSQNIEEGAEKGSNHNHTAPDDEHRITADASNMYGSHPVVAVPIAMAAGKQTIPNLNIGMEYWSNEVMMRGKRSASASASPLPIPGAQEGAGVPLELWIQDERELKRQKRKQSNRESARRSRLRKQAECEDLAAKVDTLKAENASLRDDLTRLSEQCKKLNSEKGSLLEQLKLRRVYQGQENENTAASVMPQTEKCSSETVAAKAGGEGVIQNEAAPVVDISQTSQEGANHAVSVSAG